MLLKVQQLWWPVLVSRQLERVLCLQEGVVTLAYHIASIHAVSVLRSFSDTIPYLYRIM